MQYKQFVALTLLACAAQATLAVDLQPGDVIASLIGNNEGASIMKIDPITGDRETISGAGVGSGVAFGYPLDVVHTTNGLYVTDRDLDAILLVDPANGERSVVSGPGVGTGPSLMVGDQDVLSISVEPATGMIWAAQPLSKSLVRIDPTTGNRENMSSAVSQIGSGPAFSTVTDIAFASDGRLFVADQGLNAILSIDPTSGDRSILSSADVGLGPAFSNATMLTTGANHGIFVADWSGETWGGQLIEVDANSGDRRPIASGEFLDTVVDIELSRDGELITSHPFNLQMFKTNRFSGVESLLSATPDFGLTTDRGEGPPLNFAVLTEIVGGDDKPVTTHDVSVPPIFDAQADCFFQGCSIKDDELAIHPINFPDAGVNTDRRAVLEFDLGKAAGDLESARLELAISHAHINDEGDISMLDLYGYVGDGVATNEDGERTQRIVGRTFPIHEKGRLGIELDPTYVQEVIDGGDTLGLLIKSRSERLSTSFWSTEFVERFPNDGFEAPELVLTYAGQGDLNAGLVGDFDGSGDYGENDINQLCDAINGTETRFDLNNDGQVSLGDVDTLLESMGVIAGDADLNGIVEFADFLLTSHNFGEVANWGQGDFDCNGTAEFADFLILSFNFGERAELASVPEPSNVLAWFGPAFLGLLWRRRVRIPYVFTKQMAEKDC